LGTPVVCLDHGGPAEVVRRWPTSLSRRITPAGPAVTARRIAEAIDGFLADPPPLRSAPVRPNVSFADSLLAAYEQAARSAARPKGSLGSAPAGGGSRTEQQLGGQP
jgi:hypothetical protein